MRFRQFRRRSVLLAITGERTTVSALVAVCPGGSPVAMNLLRRKTLLTATDEAWRHVMERAVRCRSAGAQGGAPINWCLSLHALRNLGGLKQLGDAPRGARSHCTIGTNGWYRKWISRHAKAFDGQPRLFQMFRSFR
jgi:hypothetical protein